MQAYYVGEFLRKRKDTCVNYKKETAFTGSVLLCTGYRHFYVQPLPISLHHSGFYRIPCVSYRNAKAHGHLAFCHMGRDVPFRGHVPLPCGTHLFPLGEKEISLSGGFWIRQISYALQRRAAFAVPFGHLTGGSALFFYKKRDKAKFFD